MTHVYPSFVPDTVTPIKSVSQDYETLAAPPSRPLTSFAIVPPAEMDVVNTPPILGALLHSQLSLSPDEVMEQLHFVWREAGIHPSITSSQPQQMESTITMDSLFGDRPTRSRVVAVFYNLLGEHCFILIDELFINILSCINVISA